MADRMRKRNECHWSIDDFCPHFILDEIRLWFVNQKYGVKFTAGIQKTNSIRATDIFHSFDCCRKSLLCLWRTNQMDRNRISTIYRSVVTYQISYLINFIFSSNLSSVLVQTFRLDQIKILFYIPLMSIASQRHTCPNAPSPKILKNFNRCLGKSHRSDFPCEFELLVDSCDVA